MKKYINIQLIEKTLNLLYTLEDEFEYDDTKLGLKIGETINELQNALFKE